MFQHQENVFNSLVWLHTDIGADVLDLAETMVASDGLKYEPVSVIFFHAKNNKDLIFAITDRCVLHNLGPL